MFHIIYNPVAGKGKSERFRSSIEKLLLETKTDYTFYETQKNRDAVEIARSLTEKNSDDFLDIVAMGGDGTLHEVLNGIKDPAKVRLGLIPCGSGNDFAAIAGIPASSEGAIDVLLNSSAKYTDYLECSGKRGINVIGTGIDVDILNRRAKAKFLKGSLCYLAALIVTIATYKSKRFFEIINDKKIPHCAMIACAANGQRIGGGIHVCPEASIDDGQLDILVVDNLKKRQLPGAFIKLMQKKIFEHPHAIFRRSDHMLIETESPMPLQIDGEIYENIPFDVQIIHKKLQMYRP